jgi:hypothetical protein
VNAARYKLTAANIASHSKTLATHKHNSQLCTVTCTNASHKSNPSSVPRGTVDSYSALPWVTWEAVIVVEGIP